MVDFNSSFTEYLKEKEETSKRITEDIENKKSVIIEKNMSGAEVARELGISRQMVKRVLHRSVTKIYKGIRELPEYKNDPKMAFFILVKILNQDQGTPEDWREILKMLDPKYMKEIEDSLKSNNTED